jgi:signal transduction histidine kinase
VDRDEREHIFEKFSRGRRSTTTSGAGLGLSIARSLVELHGGSIRYEDASGGGARFVVMVPVGIE